MSVPATTSPVRSVQEPDPAPAPTAVDESTDPTPTEPPQSTASPPDAPTTTPTTTPTALEINERGNAVLGLGEQLTVLDHETGALVLAVAVDSVSVDVTCTSRDAAPPAGHLIAVRVRATTGSDLAAVAESPRSAPRTSPTWARTA